jgi:hypothetical protein
MVAFDQRGQVIENQVNVGGRRVVSASEEETEAGAVQATVNTDLLTACKAASMAIDLITVAYPSALPRPMMDELIVIGHALSAAISKVCEEEQK